MSLKHAYCVDLGKVMNIYTAQERFHQQPKTARRRFRFECADDACRIRLHPTVTGVLYDRAVTDLDAKERMQFKWGPHAIHAMDCRYLEEREAADVQEEDRLPVTSGLNRGLTLENVDSADIFDLFDPGGESTINAVQEEREKAVRVIVDRVQRVRARARQQREQPSETGVFEDIVEAFDLMSPSDRARATLMIRGLGTKSYADHFVRMGARVRVANRGIYFGGVYYEPAKGGHRLRFYDSIAPGHPMKPGMYFSANKVAAYRRGATLLEKLEALRDGRADWASCYFFGSVENANVGGRPVADINVDHLDHLVIRLKQRAQPQAQ